MDIWGNLNMVYRIDAIELVLNLRHVIICDCVKEGLCFWKIFAVNSKVSQCLQLLTCKRFGQKKKKERKNVRENKIIENREKKIQQQKHKSQNHNILRKHSSKQLLLWVWQ